MQSLTFKVALGAASLACLAGAQATQADYKFSGALDLGYYDDFDGHTKTGSISRSNIAFDAVKDLGAGMAATLKLNSRFFLRNPNTREHLVNEDPDYLFAGEATAGLKGDFGHVRAGRALTALWQNDWAYDAWYNFDSIASPAWQTWHGNSPADPNASSKNASFSRLNHGVFYASPTVSGFSADASLGLKKQTGDRHNSVSLALKYTQDQFKAMWARERTPVGHKVQFLGLQYRLGAVSLMGAHDVERLADGSRNRSTTFSARWSLGNVSLMAGLGRQLDYKANFLGLGAEYQYNPSTRLYLSYGRQQQGFWGSASSRDAIGAGVNYSF